jgi:hypothetical protein
MGERGVEFVADGVVGTTGFSTLEVCTRDVYSPSHHRVVVASTPVRG